MKDDLMYIMKTNYSDFIVSEQKKQFLEKVIKTRMSGKSNSVEIDMDEFPALNMRDVEKDFLSCGCKVEIYLPKVLTITFP